MIKTAFIGKLVIAVTTAWVSLYPAVNTVSANSQNEPADGTIISRKLVKVTGQNPNINIYKVFFESDGLQIEALLTTPKARGHYPVLMMLHGGYLGAQPSIKHYQLGYTPELVSKSSDEMITFEPNYRGYLDSQGTIGDIYEDTMDVRNAIKAVESLPNISKSLYLIGNSLGGDLALKIASECSDVKAVALVSPFVGWDETIDWFKQHPKAHSIAIDTFRPLVRLRQNFYAKHPSLYRSVSLIPAIDTIKAPVLFLQGTGDQSVVWQTVQDYAQRMKRDHKTVRLVLYPGGTHGLHDKFQSESYSEITNWMELHGAPNPFPYGP